MRRIAIFIIETVVWVFLCFILSRLQWKHEDVKEHLIFALAFVPLFSLCRVYFVNKGPSIKYQVMMLKNAMELIGTDPKTVEGVNNRSIEKTIPLRTNSFFVSFDSLCNFRKFFELQNISYTEVDITNLLEKGVYLLVYRKGKTKQIRYPICVVFDGVRYIRQDDGEIFDPLSLESNFCFGYYLGPCKITSTTDI